MSHVRKKVRNLGRNDRNYVQSTSVMFKLTPEQRQELKDAPRRALESMGENSINVYAIKTLYIRIHYARFNLDLFDQAEHVRPILNRGIRTLDQLLETDYANSIVLPTVAQQTLLHEALNVADEVDEHTTRPLQYKTYVSALELVERNPIFRF